MENQTLLLTPDERLTYPELLSRLDRQLESFVTFRLSADFHTLYKRFPVLGDEVQAAQCDLERRLLQFDLPRQRLDDEREWLSQPDVRSHIQQRFDTTPNPLLRARYAVLLYDGDPNRNRPAALSAVDLLLTAAAQVQPLDLLERRRNDHYDAVLTLLVTLSHQLGYQRSAVGAEVIRLTTDPQTSLDHRAALLHLLVGIVPSIMPREASRLAEACRLVYEQRIAENNAVGYYCASSIADTGLKFQARAASRGATRAWHTLIAQAEEAKAREVLARNPTSFVWASSFADAIKAWKKAGDTQRARTLETEYERWKYQIRMPTVRFEHSFSSPGERAVFRLFDNVRNKLLSLDSFNLYYHLVKCPLYVVSQLGFLVRFRPKPDAFERTVRPVVFGHRRNLVNSQKHPHQNSFAYQLSYKVTIGIVSHQLRQLLEEAARAGTFNADSLLAYLEHSWIGQRGISDARSDDDEASTYGWSDLLAPALTHGISQLQRHAADATVSPELILAIDSLTPRLEALLRDLLRACGGASAQGDQHGQLEEKTIEVVLNDPILKSCLTENERDTLRLLLTSQGLNLRNRVAHGLMYRHHYTVENFHYLLLALLIIASAKAPGGFSPE